MIVVHHHADPAPPGMVGAAVKGVPEAVRERGRQAGAGEAARPVHAAERILAGQPDVGHQAVQILGGVGAEREGLGRGGQGGDPLRLGDVDQRQLLHGWFLCAFVGKRRDASIGSPWSTGLRPYASTLTQVRAGFNGRRPEVDSADALRHRVAMSADNGFEIRRAGDNDALGNMVMETASGRLLGGVGHNDLRSWCYPLNTPRGLGVTQEYAFDHAFHNGVFVAQARVVCGGVLSNFWVVHPDWRSPDSHVYNHLGQIRYRERADITPLASGFRFSYHSTWNGCDGAPVLDEVRHFDLYAAADAHHLRPHLAQDRGLRRAALRGQQARVARSAGPAPAPAAVRGRDGRGHGHEDPSRPRRRGGVRQGARLRGVRGGAGRPGALRRLPAGPGQHRERQAHRAVVRPRLRDGDVQRDHGRGHRGRRGRHVGNRAAGSPPTTVRCRVERARTWAAARGGIR